MKTGEIILIEAEYLQPYYFEGKRVDGAHVINVRACTGKIGKGIELMVTEEVIQEETNKRELTNEDLLKIMVDWHKKHNKTPGFRDFAVSDSVPSPTLYSKRFGSWNNAVKKAGLPTNKIGGNPSSKIFIGRKVYQTTKVN